MSTPIGMFREQFDVAFAYSPDLIETAYALRYQVYCEETRFEDPRQFPDRLERDDYDDRSVHALVRHRPTDSFIGVVRLVLPDPGDPEVPFPIEKNCGDGLDRGVLRRAGASRGAVAEISRFAVSKSLKRRVAHHAAGQSAPEAGPVQAAHGSDRNWLPHVTLGLFAGIVRLSADHGISHWYAVMEPTLMRLLTRFGVQFQPIGPAVEYHGRRIPALACIDETLTSAYHRRRDVWDLVTEGGRLWPVDGPVPAVG